jgi:hypothetical protein
LCKSGGIVRRWLLVLILAFAAQVVPGTSSNAAEPVRILIVGDSQTVGSAGDWTWRYRLDRHLRTSGVAFDLVGPRDDLYDNVNERAGSQAYVDRAFDRNHFAGWGGNYTDYNSFIGSVVVDHQPDLVVVMLGTNDLVWKAKTPAEVAALARTFVGNVRAARPGVDVVIVEPPHSDWPREVELAALLPDVAADLDTTDARVVIADAQDGYAAADTYDGGHPHARGEVKLAAAVADALATLGVGATYPRPLPVVPLGPRFPAAVAISAGDSSATLTFASAPGVTGELVWIRDVSAGQQWRRLAHQVRQPSWRADLLSSGHRFDFKLQPVKGQLASDTVRSRVLSVVPGKAPTGLRASMSPFGVASVRWDARPEAASYHLLRKAPGGLWRVVARTTGTSARLSGHLSGRSYDWRVRMAAHDVGGRSSATVRGSVPLVGPVTSVHKVWAGPRTVAVAGRRVAAATSYRAEVGTTSHCGVRPRTWVARRIGLAKPAAVVGRTAGKATWVRLRGVRDGRAGRVVSTSAVCIRSSV